MFQQIETKQWFFGRPRQEIIEALFFLTCGLEKYFFIVEILIFQNENENPENGNRGFENFKSKTQNVTFGF